MIKKLQSKKLAIAVMALVSLSAIALAVLAGHYFLNMDFTMQMPICIDGVYSIDGGEWKPVNENGDIKDTFHKAVVKGTLKEEAFYMKTITITSKNVWYTLKKADGTTFVEYKNYSPEELYNEYLKWTTEENFNEEVLSFDENTILLDTALGKLTLRGENLKLGQFDTGKGDISGSGEIYALVYSSNDNSGGFFSRLFK